MSTTFISVYPFPLNGKMKSAIIILIIIIEISQETENKEDVMYAKIKTELQAIQTSITELKNFTMVIRQFIDQYRQDTEMIRENLSHWNKTLLDLNSKCGKMRKQNSHTYRNLETLGKYSKFK